MDNKKVSIIGAGLCGSLLASLLARRKFEVHIFERRIDMRKGKTEAGRSINLALSNRGLKALSLLGTQNDILKLCIPMRGRMIHQSDGTLKLLPYSGREGFYINSVSRGQLNELLLYQVELHSNANIHFEHTCTQVDLDQKVTYYTGPKQDPLSFSADYIIGTDGANSAMRNAFLKKSNQIRFDFSLQYLSHGYKELHIPPAANGSFLMEKNALHIWPRKSQMLIALPNLDGSFTVTLFQRFDGDEGLETLDADLQKARVFFEKYYPDALALMPDFEEHFSRNPSSSLATVKCWPWNYQNHSLLLGDAAHAVVPFYGQGMNCSFEDVYVLDRLLEKSANELNRAIPECASKRKINADAIADLAVDNFYEMRDHSGDPAFQLKNQLEGLLESRFPHYFSKYSMVTFQDDCPYFKAMVIGRLQDEFLMNLCRQNPKVDQIDLEKLLCELQHYVQERTQHLNIPDNHI